MKNADVKKHIRLKEKGQKTFFKLCHVCGTVSESPKEIERCSKCRKSFLPVNYSHHSNLNEKEFLSLFSDTEEISEEDLIKGIHVIW